jgi:RNA polymerase sigma factor (sigma-70 family)
MPGAPHHNLASLSDKFPGAAIPEISLALTLAGMDDATDHQLLQQYTRDGSEEAFKALVDRYLNLVYSVAKFRLGEAAAAKDITQVVFAVLARKGGRLSEKVVLSGWLFQVATHACQDLQRAEARRKKWENEAVQQQLAESNEDRSDFTEVGPMISRALSSLAAAERDAILLRFIENREFRQIGVQLGISEAAAKMRVARGLERLRGLLQQHGITLSEAALSGAVPHVIQRAPDGLGALVKANTVLHASLSQSNTLLLKGVLNTMAWSNTKTALALGAGLLLATGGATSLYLHNHHPLGYPRSSWTAVGHNDPPSALARILSYASEGNGERLLSSVSPQMQRRMQDNFGKQVEVQGISLAQILVDMGRMWVRGVEGFDVIGQDVSADGNTINLHVRFKGRQGDSSFRLIRIDGEWKLDNFS